jgi:hypothetical protein
MIPNNIQASMNQTKLVCYPCEKYRFNVPVVFRSKAQYEGNGYSLAEHCNAHGLRCVS